VKDLHEEEQRDSKNKPEEVRQFRLSILDELRLYAKLGTIEKTAERLGEDRGNLSKRINKFKQDWPQISMVVDAVRKEQLLEKASSKEARMKRLQARIERGRNGFITAREAHFGYDNKDGVPVENAEFKTLEAVFNLLREGKKPGEIAAKLDLSPGKVSRLLRDRFYIGEFVVAGETCNYSPNKKSLFTPEEWDEIQLLLAPSGKGPLLRGYIWKDGRGVLTEQGRRDYKNLFKMRVEGRMGQEKIAKELGWGVGSVFRALHDRRITGKMEVDGKLVDSGYEPAIDNDTWKRAQQISAKPPWEIRKQERQESERKIMSCMPAFRWELVEKGISYNVAFHRVLALKKAKMLKERADGLLQRDWELFPDKTWKTRDRGASKQREKILTAFQVGHEITRKELQGKTGLPYATISHHVRKMVKEGILKEDENSKLTLGFFFP
jgi:DNA-binding MarR family transcriptional regulator